MDRQTSCRLLRMIYSLLKVKDEFEISQSVARDLYDLVEQQTTDLDLRYQMQEARAMGWDRKKTILYLNHRLNLGLYHVGPVKEEK